MQFKMHLVEGAHIHRGNLESAVQVNNMARL